MIKTENFDTLEIDSLDQLRNWLLVNHTQEESIWLITYKKAVPDKYVSRWDVLDELICFGWIDGIRRKLDEEKTMQLISKRRVEHWAKTYKERAAKLIQNDRMHSAGCESIELSKSSGLWDFMNDVDNLIIPNDLKEALGEKAKAFDFFNGINDSSKRFVLRWIKLAKTEQTRSNRIQKIFDLSVMGKKLPGS
jgi:uncharacterized protein YdeI (YjbR/CyaY-like superfamily)